MSKIKRILSASLLALLVLIPLVAQASTVVYNSTYSMTGGVESKRFYVKVPGTWTTETWGYKGPSGGSFSVFLMRDVVGPDYDTSTRTHQAIGYTKSSTSITSTNDGSGDYYVYLRNYTGVLMEGDIRITVTDSQ